MLSRPGGLRPLRIGCERDEQSCHHRRRRHRRAGDGADAAPDRRALHRVRGGARDAPARRRHQPAAQCRARALRPRHHRGRSRPRRPAGQGMGAGRAQRQRHLFRAARAARRLQLAAIRGASRPASTCCCYDKVVERIGPDAVRLGSRVTGYRKNADGGVTRARRARRRLDLRGARRAADRRRRHPLGGARADAPRPAADPLGRRDHVARHDLGASRSAPAPRSSASARTASAWCSIRSRIPTRRPASR